VKIAKLKRFGGGKVPVRVSEHVLTAREREREERNNHNNTRDNYNNNYYSKRENRKVEEIL